MDRYPACNAKSDGSSQHSGNKFHFGAVALLWLWMPSLAASQTPWEAAPARPAEMPSKNLYQPKVPKKLQPLKPPSRLPSATSQAQLNHPAGERLAPQNARQSSSNELGPARPSPTAVLARDSASLIPANLRSTSTNAAGSAFSQAPPVSQSLPRQTQLPRQKPVNPAVQASLPVHTSGPAQAYQQAQPMTRAPVNRYDGNPNSDFSPPFQSNTNFANSQNPTVAVQQTANRSQPGGTGAPMNGSQLNAESKSGQGSVQAGDLIAVVGDQHILAGDMLAFVEPKINELRDRLTETQIEQARTVLIRQVLKQYVEIKAKYQEFFRDVAGGKPPAEVAEMKKQIATRASRLFFEKRVPQLLEQYEVKDISELEAELRSNSLSLLTMREQFTEQILAMELERKYVPNEFEITRDELLADYEENREKWYIPARAKWRELAVRFDNHESRAEADRLIKEMGNEVLFGGKPFEAVARDSSEGYTAEEGGLYDWTTQDSLKSKEIDAALFSLPLNRLSKVIEDDVGFHIIEVLAREKAQYKDFREAQQEIRETLRKRRRKKAQAEFTEEVLSRTSIWTRWPEDIEGSKPLAQAIGDL